MNWINWINCITRPNLHKLTVDELLQIIKWIKPEYPNPNTNSIYNIVATSGYYNIVNTKNQKLIVFNKNLIKFSDITSSTDSLFKLDISYDLLN